MSCQKLDIKNDNLKIFSDQILSYQFLSFKKCEVKK